MRPTFCTTTAAACSALLLLSGCNGSSGSEAATPKPVRILGNGGFNVAGPAHGNGAVISTILNVVCVADGQTATVDNVRPVSTLNGAKITDFDIVRRTQDVGTDWQNRPLADMLGYTSQNRRITSSCKDPYKTRDSLALEITKPGHVNAAVRSVIIGYTVDGAHYEQGALMSVKLCDNFDDGCRP